MLGCEGESCLHACGLNMRRGFGQKIFPGLSLTYFFHSH